MSWSPLSDQKGVKPTVEFGERTRDCSPGHARKEGRHVAKMGVPWTARSSNQSILKEISPGISLQGMMLKLKLQYFGHLMWRVAHWKRLWCWEGLGAGGEGDDRGWDGWMASPSQCTWVWVNSGSWWWTGRPGVLWFMGSQRVGHDWVTEWNWTEWPLVGRDWGCCKYLIMHRLFTTKNNPDQNVNTRNPVVGPCPDDPCYSSTSHGRITGPNSQLRSI